MSRWEQGFFLFLQLFISFQPFDRNIILVGGGPKTFLLILNRGFFTPFKYAAGQKLCVIAEKMLQMKWSQPSCNSDPSPKVASS